MSVARFLELWPDDLELVLADVGSAGGLKDRWRPARPVVSALLFEPRDGGEPRRVGRDMLYPVALGPEAGRATLNVTALSNMSSTLRPNRALLEAYRKKGEHTRITGTLEMPVDTLDAVLARDGRRADAIKVDTQGSELGILEGARGALRDSIFLAEVEVSFFERYEGQPLFRDIEAFMREAGFELLDLYRLKRYRRRNSAGVANLSLGGGQRAGRLAYGDALFFREEAALLERVAAEGEMLALKAILGMLVYGKPDMAADLFDRTAHVFTPLRREKAERYFSGLGAQRIRGRKLHGLLDRLSRRV